MYHNFRKNLNNFLKVMLEVKQIFSDKKIIVFSKFDFLHFLGISTKLSSKRKTTETQEIKFSNKTNSNIFTNNPPLTNITKMLFFETFRKLERKFF